MNKSVFTLSSIALVSFLTLAYTSESKASDIISEHNLGSCIEQTNAKDINSTCAAKKARNRNSSIYRWEKISAAPKREIPVILLTRKEFNDRLKLSPLWNILNKRGNYVLERASYYLHVSSKSTDAYSVVSILSTLDSTPNDWQPLTNITYELYDGPQSHELMGRQKSEMIEVLKIVFDDLDHQQALQLLEDLYKQYTDNLATEPLTEKAVVGSIEYDGKIIILQGVRSAAKDTILFMEII